MKPIEQLSKKELTAELTTLEKRAHEIRSFLEKQRQAEAKELFKNTALTLHDVFNKPAEYFNSDAGHKAKQSIMAKYKFIRSSGYFPEEPSTYGLQIVMYKNIPLQEQLNEILPAIEMLPYRKFDGKIVKLISIFEHTLSQYAVYRLVIEESGTCHLYRNNFSDKRIDNLNGMLDYIRMHHYYQKNFN